MKIISNMKDNFLTCYDEAKGVAFNKKKILRTKSSKSLSYFQTVIIITLILSLLALISVFIDECYILSTLIITIELIYLLITVVNTICITNIRKKQNYKSEITIDEKGITGEFFNGITMTFHHDKLKAIVVKKNTVVILTNSSIYFYFTIKEKENIIKAFKKYNKDIQIIDHE